MVGGRRAAACLLLLQRTGGGHRSARDEGLKPIPRRGI
jgi:hypothetical protein